MRYMNTLELESAASVVAWAYRELTTPMPQMRRSDAATAEPVCPFLLPSLRSGHCFVALPEESGGMEGIRRALLDSRDLLVTEAAHDPDRLLSVILILDRVAHLNVAALDPLLKGVTPALREAGLMAALFHNSSRNRSVRNPELRVSKSPVPLIALRQMAIHDILFLENDADGFAAYERRFGSEILDASRTRPQYQAVAAAYRRARARFAGAGQQDNACLHP